MKNKQIIDYEEGRITIRVTKTIYFLLQSDIAHFNFKDNKGEYNENIFYNTILSIMAKDRIKQQEKLKRKLELEISETINKGMKEKVLSTIVAEMYNTFYNKRDGQALDSIIQFRLSKDNMKNLLPVFAEVEKIGWNKTQFIRSVLIEFANLSTDNREYICCKKEIDDLDSLCKDNIVISFNYLDYDYSIITCYVDVSFHNDEYYLIGLDKDSLEIRAFKIYYIKDINILSQKVNISDAKQEEVKKFLEDNIFMDDVEVGEENEYI